MKTMNQFLKEAEECIKESDAPTVVSGGPDSVGTPEGLNNRVVVKKIKRRTKG